ncbi:hypothetical protein [Xenorhabdus koppenhoeferi]|uniref:Uncharacterized protein n=1 Tax=Xenorhabdus koppenhoeferi TaxID=351659 RepID=A0A1I7K8Q8_9GAMM|nr:hypothetical protein [Xenorhabdus koppenhoeferi]SFU93833.1 hypothetical protein SAMN05421784_14932 [Xenorhabdus koppenhoeferi]
MNSYPRRSVGCLVPKDPAKRSHWLDELVASIINKTDHPANLPLKEQILAEKIHNFNHYASFHPPLPHHMAEERAKLERQAWRDYYATHHTEYDHYRGHSPTRRHGGIWTGD